MASLFTTSTHMLQVQKDFLPSGYFLHGQRTLLSPLLPCRMHIEKQVPVVRKPATMLPVGFPHAPFLLVAQHGFSIALWHNESGSRPL